MGRGQGEAGEKLAHPLRIATPANAIGATRAPTGATRILYGDPLLLQRDRAVPGSPVDRLGWMLTNEELYAECRGDDDWPAPWGSADSIDALCIDLWFSHEVDRWANSGDPDAVSEFGLGAGDGWCYRVADADRVDRYSLLLVPDCSLERIRSSDSVGLRIRTAPGELEPVDWWSGLELIGQQLGLRLRGKEPH